MCQARVLRLGADCKRRSGLWPLRVTIVIGEMRLEMARREPGVDSRAVKSLALVFFGSGAGGVARYLIGLGAVRWLGPAFPYGTLAVNLIGSFLITFILRLSVSVPAITPEVRLLLTTGVMGGLTTYSTFNHETLTLLQGQSPVSGALNVAITIAGCLLSGYLGLAAARALG